jgi:gas vesicle protein
MTSDPEQIRADIEYTRMELGTDVDALADKVRPSSIVDRQRNRIKNAVGRARDTVMGTASDAASTVGETVGDLPHKAAETTRGNPIAVGLVAFGLGWLAASLLPASGKERELARTAKDKAAPAMDNLKESAQTVAEDMKEPAKDAAESVKDAAQDAVGNVRQSTSSGTPSSTESPVPATGYGMDDPLAPTTPRDPLSGGNSPTI